MSTQTIQQQKIAPAPSGAQGGELGFTSTLGAKRYMKAPLSWRLRNLPNRLRALPALMVYRTLGKLFGLVYMESSLSARAFHPDGTVIDYGIVSRRVVTTAGVNFLVDAFQNIVEIELMKFHASGTSATAEAVGDTALIAEATTITDRATGSQTEGASANIYKTVGTQSYTGSGTIQEHGIFSVVTESTGVLWDRSLTGGQAVVAGSAIEWTYSLTVTAGG